MSKLEEYKTVKTEIHRLQEEAKEKSKTLFNEVAKEIFAKYPELEEISWRQYTPYFNDGDVCTFHNCSDDAMVNGDDMPWKKEEQTEMHKEIKAFLGTFDDDDYLTMFGDHAKVTVNKAGIEVDFYEHD